MAFDKDMCYPTTNLLSMFVQPVYRKDILIDKLEIKAVWYEYKCGKDLDNDNKPEATSTRCQYTYLTLQYTDGLSKCGLSWIQILICISYKAEFLVWKE